MQFKTKAKPFPIDPSRSGPWEEKWLIWCTRFALWPTPVGVLPDGSVVKVWFEFYESRSVDTTGDLPFAPGTFQIFRRPRRKIEGLTTYRLPAYCNEPEIVKTTDGIVERRRLRKY